MYICQIYYNLLEPFVSTRIIFFALNLEREIS